MALGARDFADDNKNLPRFGPHGIFLVEACAIWARLSLVSLIYPQPKTKEKY